MTPQIGPISDWNIWSGGRAINLASPIAPSGIASTAAVGTPSLSTVIDLTGFGIASTAAVGTPGVNLIAADRFAAIYIDGVDMSGAIESEGGGKSGIQRSIQTGSGGSKATCQFTLNNENGPISVPGRLTDVQIFTRDDDGNTVKFFGGIVDKTSSYNYSGTADLTRITVTCVDYGSLLDRVVVGREIQMQIGNDPCIITYQLSLNFFEPRVGVKYKFTGFPPRGGLGDVIFNWVSGTDAMNRVAQDSGGNWRVDFDKVLYLFGGTGYRSAPFSIEQNDGNWRNLRVDQDVSRYRNRIYVKTSQNNRPLWTDRFTTTYEGEYIWITMAPMNGKPIVRVSHDGGMTFTVATVINADELGSRPYDFYWINTTLISHFTFDPTPPYTLTTVPVGTIIDVTYLSPLSYVTVAEDLAAIAADGLFEGVETVPDVPTMDAQQAWADALLERRMIKPTTITFETDRYGLEAGMSLVVDVPRSEVDDVFMITSVQTSEQAKKFFRHQVTAVDVTSQLGDDAAFFKALMAKTESHRDRVMEEIHFQLAETINGFENPGMSVDDEQFAVRNAPVTGILHSCILNFNSQATPPTVDSIIDVLQDGVSIFADGDENKLIWPAGAISVQTKLDFRADPMEVQAGDKFTIELIAADSANHDGTLTIKIIPR